MKKELKEWLSKQEFQYLYVEFKSLNFCEILNGDCSELDNILPKGDVVFTIFKVKNIGEFIITRSSPPLRDDTCIGKYKRFYVTSLDSFVF